MTRQPLWVILCRRPEEGRKEIVEEMNANLRVTWNTDQDMF